MEKKSKTSSKSEPCDNCVVMKKKVRTAEGWKRSLAAKKAAANRPTKSKVA